MEHLLEKYNLKVHDNVKKTTSTKQFEKKPSYETGRDKGHALVAVTFSSSTWVIDSVLLYHMASLKDVFTSMDSCRYCYREIWHQWKSKDPKWLNKGITHLSPS